MDDPRTNRGRTFRALMRFFEVANSALIFGRLALPFLLLALAHSVPLAQYEALRAELVQAEAEAEAARGHPALIAWELTRLQKSQAAEECSTE